MRSYKLVYGISGNKRWIAGNIPVKSGVVHYIDTRTSEGVDIIINYMHDFITYQARGMHVPTYTNEDLLQELTCILIAGIPNFTLQKSVNLITFLQNHIKNRMINLYKFSTEKRRTATHSGLRICKLVCPKCRATLLINESEPGIDSCVSCGLPKDSPDWRQYPISIAPISGEQISHSNGDYRMSIFDCISKEDRPDFFGGAELAFDQVHNALLIKSILHKLTEQEVNLFNLVLLGKTTEEVATDSEISSAAARSRIASLIAKVRSITNET